MKKNLSEENVVLLLGSDYSNRRGTNMYIGNRSIAKYVRHICQYIDSVLSALLY